MKITLAKTAGFCYGVNRAVNILDECTENNEKIVTLGPLIHNPDVVRNFEKKGVFSVNLPENVPDNATVVLRTHGVDKKTIDILGQKKM